MIKIVYYFWIQNQKTHNSNIVQATVFDKLHITREFVQKKQTFPCELFWPNIAGEIH